MSKYTLIIAASIVLGTTFGAAALDRRPFDDRLSSNSTVYYPSDDERWLDRPKGSID